MKKLLSVTLLIVLTLTLALTGCGRKQIQSIDVGDSLQREFEINEKPDFSGVTATIIYNDSTTKPVGASELEFGALDTSTPGTKQLSITYDGFTASFDVTVKDKSIDEHIRTLENIEYFGGLPSTIYVGDILTFENITIVANYVNGKGDKTQETLTVATNTNIKHNGSEIDTSKAGKQTLTIAFSGKSVNVAHFTT
jgi:hypothetical protein